MFKFPAERSLTPFSARTYDDAFTYEPCFEEQEQTKFYDLRRGITKDFQRLAKFHRIYQKVPKRFTNFKLFAFLTFFDL